MGFFNLPFSVRIADSSPIDGDRYIAANVAARNAILDAGRAQAGQQIYVVSEQKLYILVGSTNADWVEVGAGAGSGDLNYVHTQTASNSHWNITHNLGKMPSVQVLDGSNHVVESEIIHIDNNTLSVNFNVAFAGIAILN